VRKREHSHTAFSEFSQAGNGGEKSRTVQRFCHAVRRRSSTRLQNGNPNLETRVARGQGRCPISDLGIANRRESCLGFLWLARALTGGEYNFESQPRNPSLDVSVLHVLSKNPHLFFGIHDNSLRLAVMRALSKKFRSNKSSNAFSGTRSQIEEGFCEENLWLFEHVLHRG
jgi:hypothetical protein